MPGSRGRMATLPSQEPVGLQGRLLLSPPAPSRLNPLAPPPRQGSPTFHLTREAPIKACTSSHGPKPHCCPGGQGAVWRLGLCTMRHRVGVPSWERPGCHREAEVTGCSPRPRATLCCPTSNLDTVGAGGWRPPLLQAGVQPLTALHWQEGLKGPDRWCSPGLVGLAPELPRQPKVI